MRVEKERYLVPVSHSLTFEVDVFKGLNKGLVVAEIELPSIDTPFEKPEWLGKEVTGKVAYYNVMLAQNPFRNW
jgi:adenylate cyclase